MLSLYTKLNILSRYHQKETHVAPEDSSSRYCVPIGYSPFPHSVSWKLPDKPTNE